MSKWLSAVVTTALLSASSALAAEHQISVVSAEGKPVSGAVVYLEPLDHVPTAVPADAVMDQIDRQFSPHILVVQRGAAVSFPNSDSIKHHVFSFSQAKTFEIRLYSDEPVAPVQFDQEGVVELGCNVHDWMLGYIFVVDTPYFSRTDAGGNALIRAPGGRYEVGAWHPRFADSPDTLATELAADQINLQIRLKQALLPDYLPASASDIDDYD